MCCFSRNAVVGHTRIFARLLGNGRQALAYQMDYKAKKRLAMILPIPVPPKSAEDAVKFLSLDAYRVFFQELEKGFPKTKVSPKKEGGFFGGGRVEEPKLVVVEVGNYVASFVPGLKDFARLDEDFRLPTKVWEALPQYADYGFAVFQLKPDAQSVHPLAFTFPTRDAQQIFFPTVHIHDGLVKDQAVFEHTLYLQPEKAEQILPEGWEESNRTAGSFVDARRSQGLIDAEQHCFRRVLLGRQRNEDIVVAKA